MNESGLRLRIFGLKAEHGRIFVQKSFNYPAVCDDILLDRINSDCSFLRSNIGFDVTFGRRGGWQRKNIQGAAFQPT